VSSVPTSNCQHERSTVQLFYAIPAEISSTTSWAFAGVGLIFVRIHVRPSLVLGPSYGDPLSKSDHFEATSIVMPWFKMTKPC
jgi:hypothetical protein